MRSGERIEDDRLAEAANRGDRAAAGEYLTRNLPLLSGMARRLSTDALDPDDLLAEALVNLLAKWSAGTGPASGANAYVIRSMRNRVVDELRSPRSRVLPLPEDEQLMPVQEPSTRAADLHREYSIVATALGTLPEDQRRALWATVVEGRKPADLAAELERPASAVYALSRRARVGLRRAALRVVLEEGAPESCRGSAARLPETIPQTLDEAADSAGMAHIRTCERCRAAWTRFSAMASALGVCSVLVAGSVAVPTATALAAEPAGRVRGSERTRAGRDPLRARTGSRARLSQGGGATALSLGAIAVGIVLVVSSLISIAAASGDRNERAVGEETAPGSQAPVVELLVTSQKPVPGQASIQIELRGAGAESHVSLVPSEGLSVVSAPAGWECEIEGGSAECGVVGAVAGEFTLSDTRPGQNGRYEVTATTSLNGRMYSGFAEGRVAPDPKTVSARAG